MADLVIETQPRFQKKGLPDIVKLSNLQNLLEDALVSTGHVEKAALISRHDVRVSAATVAFKVDAEKAAMFVHSFQSPAVTRQRGLTVNGVKYDAVRADDLAVYAKNEGSGLILVQTATHVLVAFYNEHMHASVAAEAAEKLADYLREKGK